MADITRDDIFDKDLAQPLRELNEEFAKTLEMLKKTTLEAAKTNASLKSGGSDEAAASTRKLAEEQKKLIAAQKEQQKAADALQKQRQKALEQIAKLEQQQRELVEAANMEAKTYEQLSQKMSALNKLRKQQDLSTQEGRAAYQSMTKQVMDLNKQLMAMDAEVGTHSRNVGNYKSALDTVNMSLGEMKRALRELRNVPLAGKTPEEIAQLEKQIASLTDEMADYQARMRSSGDSTQVMIEGLQGVDAVAQGVTAGLSAMGYNTEKLDKAMVQLIGVSQALATIHELNEKQTLKTVAAVIKDTYAKVANAVATKGLALATEGSTKATRAFGQALNKIPLFAIIAGVAALAAGLVALTTQLLKQSDAQKAATRDMNAYNEVNKKVVESAAEQELKLTQLLGVVNDSNKSDSVRLKALKDITEATGGVVNATNLSAESLKTVNEQTLLYIELAKLRAKSDAAMQLATEEYKKQLEAMTDPKRNKIVVENIGDIFNVDAFSNAIKANYLNLKKVVTTGQAVSNRDVAQTIVGLQNERLDKEVKESKEKQDIFLKIWEETEAEISKIEIKLPTPKNNLDKLTKDVQETQKEIVDVWSEVDEAFDTEINTTKTQKAIEDMDFALKSFEREKTVLDTMFDGMIEGLEKADVETNKTKSDFQVAVGAMKKAIDDYGGAAQTVYSSLNEIIENNYQAQLMAIDAQQKQSDEYYANKMKAYKEKEGSEAAQEELAAKQLQDNKRIEREKIRLARREAIYKRSKALFEIGIATATAIIKQLDATPLPSGAPFVAAVAAAGVAQTAAVLSKPMPQYYTGLDDAKTDHLATIAERGRELMQLPDGSLKLFDEKQPVFVPKHSKIYDNAETEALLNGLIISSMNGIKSGSKNDYDFDKLDKRLAAIDITIKRKPVPMLKSGYSLRDIDYIKRYDV